jgi:hypothetical protein
VGTTSNTAAAPVTVIGSATALPATPSFAIVRSVATNWTIAVTTLVSV